MLIYFSCIFFHQVFLCHVYLIVSWYADYPPAPLCLQCVKPSVYLSGPSPCWDYKILPSPTHPMLDKGVLLCGPSIACILVNTLHIGDVTAPRHALLCMPSLGLVPSLRPCYQRRLTTSRHCLWQDPASSFPLHWNPHMPGCFYIPSHLSSVCQGEEPLCPTTSHHPMWIRQPFVDMLKLAVPLLSSHPETCLNADMLSSMWVDIIFYNKCLLIHTQRRPIFLVYCQDGPFCEFYLWFVVFEVGRLTTSLLCYLVNKS